MNDVAFSTNLKFNKMEFIKEEKRILGRNVTNYIYSKDIRISKGLINDLYLLSVFGVREQHSTLKSAKDSLSKHIEVLKNISIDLIVSNSDIHFDRSKGRYFIYNFAVTSSKGDGKYYYDGKFLDLEDAKEELVKAIKLLLKQVK